MATTVSPESSPRAARLRLCLGHGGGGYYSEKNTVDDEGTVTATQKVNVDMMKLARLVEELTGEKLVYTEED